MFIVSEKDGAMENNISRFKQNEYSNDRTEENATVWFLPNFEKNPDVPRPLLLWRSLKKQYPDILESVSAAAVKQWERQRKESSVLLSLSEWVFIAKEFSSKEIDDPLILWEAERIAPVCSWALGQGIYRVDPDLSHAVIETKLPDIFPLDIFSKLPEYCIYTETPHDLYEKIGLFNGPAPRIHGFFAYINDSGTMEFPILKIAMDMDNGIYSVPIKLDPHLTLKDAISLFKEDERNKDVLLKKISDVAAETLAPLLSLLLYICSDKPEIDNLREPGTAPHRVEPKKVKKGFRFFVPHEPRIWVIGEKTGKAIRKYVSGDGLSKAKRPHLRRAHWHGYWHGKKGLQEFRPVWLSPIAVNADRDEKTEKSPSENRPVPSEADTHSVP